MEKKKGIQLSQAFGAVLTLILVAVLVIIAIVIFVNLASSFEGTESISIVNESYTPAGPIVSSLAGASDCGFGDFVFISATNSSITLDAANYTTTSAGTIVNLTDEFVTTPWNVSYTYTWGSGACDASVEMVDEFNNYTSLVGLVGTIIFLGLVIGILVAAFAFGGRREV